MINEDKINAINANLQKVDYRVDKKQVDGVWMADLYQYSKLVKYAIQAGFNEIRLSIEEVDNAKTTRN